MQYLANIGTMLTQIINTLTGGDPDETFSSRIGKSRRGDYGSIRKYCIGYPIGFLIDLLFWPIEGEWDHVTRNIDDTEGDRAAW